MTSTTNTPHIDLNAKGYRMYPGRIGLARRNNAISLLRRGNVQATARRNARRILTEEFGYSEAAVREIAR